MTTACWRAGVLASDRLIDGNMEACKQFRMKNGDVLTGAGNYDDIAEVAHWLQHGGKEDSKPVVESGENGPDLLLAKPDGTCYWLTTPFLRPVRVLESFVAVGSGKEYALAAMAMGARPKRAIEIAAQFDPQTGKGVDVMRVKR